MESVQQWLVLIGEMTREWMPIVSILLIYLILRRLGKTKKNLTVKLTEPATESEIKEVNRKLDKFDSAVDMLYKEHAVLRKSKEGILSAMAAIRKDITDNDKGSRKALTNYIKKSDMVTCRDAIDTIVRQIIPLLFFQLNIDYSGEASQKPSHADRLNRFVYPKNSIWATAFQEFQKRAGEWKGENTINARLEFVQKCLQDLGMEMDGMPSRVDTLEEETSSVFAQVDENEQMLKVIRKLPTVEPLLPDHLRVEADLKPKKKTGPKRVVRMAEAHYQNIGSTVAEMREILFGADQDLIPEMCPGCNNAKYGRIRLVGRYEGQAVGDHTAYMWECGDCNHVFAFTAGITTQQQEAIDKEMYEEGIANAIVPPRIGSRHFGTRVSAIRDYVSVDQSLAPQWCFRCHTADESKIELIKQYEWLDGRLDIAYLWTCKACNRNFVFPNSVEGAIDDGADEAKKQESAQQAHINPEHFGQTVDMIHQKDMNQSMLPKLCPWCKQPRSTQIRLNGDYPIPGHPEFNAYHWSCLTCNHMFVHPKMERSAIDGEQEDEADALREELWPGYAKRSAKFIQDHARREHFPLIPSCCPHCNSFALLYITLCKEQDNLCGRKQHDWHCGKCDSIFAHPYPNETPGHPNERPNHWLEDHEQPEPEPDTRKPIRQLDAIYMGHSAPSIADDTGDKSYIPMTCPNCKESGANIALSYRQNRVKPCRGNWWHCEACEKSFAYPYEKEPQNVGRRLKGDDRGHNAGYLVSEGVASKFVPDKCPDCENKLLWLIEEQDFVSSPPTKWVCHECKANFFHPEMRLQPRHKGHSTSKLVRDGVSRRFVPCDGCSRCNHVDGVDGLHITLGDIGNKTSCWHCEKCRGDFTYDYKSSS